MSKNKHITLLLLVAVVVIMAACLTGYKLALSGTKTNPSSPTDEGSRVADGEDEESWNSSITYKGVQYTLNKDLKTVLFLGVDNVEPVDAGGNIGNNGRADMILIILLNEKTETATMLSVSRDTITGVSVYDKNGNFVYSGDMQINMQYAFGESDKKSCWLMKQVISRLLYGMTVNSYMALTMDGLPPVVDAMGGVSLTFDKDYTEIDHDYGKGKAVTLDGEASEKFVRYRDTAATGSNDARMERQNLFLNAMLQRVYKGGHTADTVSAAYAAGKDYITTDMDAETIKKLATYTLDGQVLKVPGKTLAGELHDEYYVDEGKLQDLIVKNFYIPVGK